MNGSDRHEYPVSFRVLRNVDSVEALIAKTKQALEGDYKHCCSEIDSRLKNLPSWPNDGDPSGVLRVLEHLAELCDCFDAQNAAAGRLAACLREIEVCIHDEEWETELKECQTRLSPENLPDVNVVREKLMLARDRYSQGNMKYIYAACIACFIRHNTLCERCIRQVERVIRHPDRLIKAREDVDEQLMRDPTLTVYAAPPLF